MRVCIADGKNCLSYRRFKMILSTIALLVLFASIFILFSEELRSSAKSFINNSKIRFIGSLFIVSMIILNYEEYFDDLFEKIILYTYYILYDLGITPTHYWRYTIGKILILSLISFVPIFVGKILTSIFIVGNSSKKVNYVFLLLATYLWVFFCLALTVGI